MLGMNKGQETYKAEAIAEIKAIMEANKGNEKAIAAGQIVLMEKVIAYLKLNDNYEFWNDKMVARLLMIKVAKLLR